MADQAVQRGREAQRVAHGYAGEVAVARGLLPFPLKPRDVQGVRAEVPEVLVLRVAHDADYLVGRTHGSNGSAERGSAGEKVAREALVDDRDPRCRAVVAKVELTAPEKRYPHCGEVVGCDHI